MKNNKVILSFVLVLCILSNCIIPAFAQVENSKIAASLAKRLENLPDGEKIETSIWLVFKYDRELIERETFKECGLTYGSYKTLEELDLYIKTYNRISGELEAAGNKALIEKTGVSDEDIVFCGTVSPLVILNLTKEQIYEISVFEEVQILDYDDTVLSDETPEDDWHYDLDPVEPIIPELARDYYQDNSITKRDIKIDINIGMGARIYVVKFSVAGYDYSNIITETQLGEYTLCSGEPQPLILHLGDEKLRTKLYSFEDAYKQGIINDTQLEDISRFEEVGLIKKSNLTTEPQPTTPEPTTPMVEPSENKKSKNPIKVTAKTKTVKAKKLKSKKQTVKALTIINAQGKVTATIVKNGTSKKILNKIKINKKGIITLKKGKYKKTTYKIKVKITANGNANYKSSTKTKIVKFKVK